MGAVASCGELIAGELRLNFLGFNKKKFDKLKIL
jgi:hypothetical protein